MSILSRVPFIIPFNQIKRLTWNVRNILRNAERKPRGSGHVVGAAPGRPHRRHGALQRRRTGRRPWLVDRRQEANGSQKDGLPVHRRRRQAFRRTGARFRGTRPERWRSVRFECGRNLTVFQDPFDLSRSPPPPSTAAASPKKSVPSSRDRVICDSLPGLHKTISQRVEVERKRQTRVCVKSWRTLRNLRLRKKRSQQNEQSTWNSNPYFRYGPVHNCISTRKAKKVKIESTPNNDVSTKWNN